MDTVWSILQSGHLGKEICFTHVVLVPKVNEPQDMSHLCPISLCNVIYKIGAKVIANRLKGMATIISPNQSAFMPGRLIYDNSLVAAEIRHFLHNKMSGRDGFFALKLDISKSYDRVEWRFLEVMMEKMRFASEWIKMRMAYVTSVSYSFLINDQPCGYVLPSQGLRQGDPLSLYLFLLCVEELSTLLANNKQDEALSGI